MITEYIFPEAAEFGKQIPKTRVYSSTSVSKRTKSIFVEQVERITWEYKLSPKTINIPAGTIVKEIQVLKITQRTDNLADEVLRIIDQAVPSPILFILSFRESTQYSAAYKRPSEADRAKWVISSYFKSEKINSKTKKIELPIVQNMDNLYHSLLKHLIPLAAGKNETLRDLVERAELLIIKEKEAAKLKNQISKEKQYKKKVEMNHELNKLSSQIRILRNGGER